MQKPNAILIEDNGFGTRLIDALKQRGFHVIAVKPEGDKEARLRRHMAKFTNAQVIVLKSAPGRADLEAELFAFPAAQRNDLVDALSQALDYKHVHCIWTDEAVDNYSNLLFNLMAMGVRFP